MTDTERLDWVIANCVMVGRGVVDLPGVTYCDADGHWHLYEAESHRAALDKAIEASKPKPVTVKPRTFRDRILSWFRT